MLKPPTLVWCALLGCAVLSGCDDPSRTVPTGHPAPRPPESPQEAAPSVREWVEGQGNFEVDPASRVAFSIGAAPHVLSGRFREVRGWLFLDPQHPDTVKGEVSVELESLQMEAPGQAAPGDGVAQRALEWLALGARVTAPMRLARRTARLRIDGLDGADARLQEGREMHTQVKATLEINGRRTLRRVAVVVGFDGPALAPTSVHVRSDGPFAVTLSEHDVRPRDAAGELLPDEAAQAYASLADAAQVQFELELVTR